MFKIQVMLLISLFYVVLFIHTGSAVKCYNCVEHNNPQCKDHFEKQVAVKECESGQVCIKHAQPAIRYFVTKANQQNITRNIIRDCKPQGYCEKVKDFSDYCRECSTNLCNDSVTAQSSTAMALVLGLYNVFYYVL